MLRDQIIGARVTRAEKAALVALAKNEHRRVSEVLRWLVVETARSRGLWPGPSIDEAEDVAERMGG